MFQKYKKDKFRQKNFGFTLLETIVYIALFGMIFVAISDAILTFYNSNRYTLEQIDQLNSARKGVAAMTQELREATYSASGAYPIESGSNNDIIFYANIDTDPEAERLRYFISSNNLMRGVIQPSGNPAVYNSASETTTSIAGYIRNIEQGINIFQYYDTNGTIMVVPPATINIRYIKISIVVNVNPATMPNEFTLRSSATIRNVKSNL